MSPQEGQLVLDTDPKCKAVSEALKIFCASLPHKATVPIAKVLQSKRSANAENNFNLDTDELMVTRCLHADEARTLKRVRPRARGRANQIQKRSSHVTVVVSEREA